MSQGYDISEIGVIDTATSCLHQRSVLPQSVACSLAGGPAACHKAMILVKLGL